MTKKLSLRLIGLAIVFAIATAFNEKEPWTAKQLISPKELLTLMNKPAKEQPVIYSIGPSGLIKDAIEIGSPNDKENFALLKAELSEVPKDRTVVIYCGCCPFADCPNIRPAFSLLNEMKFSEPRLLNIPQNLKVDWIDQGYPMQE